MPWPSAINVSSDGTRVVIGHGYGNYNDENEKQSFFKDDDSFFDVWDIPTSQLLPFKRDIPSVERIPTVRDVAFSPDGKYLATLLGMGYDPSITIEIWDVTDGILYRTYNFAEQIKNNVGTNDRATLNSINFSRNGNCLLLGGSGGAIYMADVSSGKILVTLKSDPMNYIKQVLYAPEEDIVYSVVRNKNQESLVEIWDVQNRRLITSLNGITEKSDISGLSYARQAKRLAVTGNGGDQIWNVGDPSSPVLLYERKTDRPGTVHSSSISISSDGKQVLTTNHNIKGNTLVKWSVPE